MSTKYLGEQITREATIAILSLIKSASRYTSAEIIAILESDHAPKTVRNILYRLKERGHITGGAYNGYALSLKGLDRLEKLQLAPLKQTKPWDATWRLVIYDIPEDQRKARDAIRKLVKKLGFTQLQQSVWIHPLPCLDEFASIRDAYGIHKHIMLIETPHSEEYADELKHFQSIYPNVIC